MRRQPREQLRPHAAHLRQRLQRAVRAPRHTLGHDAFGEGRTDAGQGLERHGVEVVERVPLGISPNPSNVGYLRTKREKMGHLFPVFSTLEDAWEGSA